MGRIALFVGAVILIFIVVVYSVIKLIGGLTAPAQSTEQKLPDRNEPASETGVVVNEIVEEPRIYENLTVTVQGVITDWVTKRSFLVRQNTNQLFSQGELLVIAAEDFPNPEDVPQQELALGDNSIIEVRGTVVIATDNDISGMFDDENASNNISRFSGRPALIADRITEIK